VHVIPYASCVDRRICPVYALLAHLGGSQLEPDTPLFSYTTGLGVEVPFTHAQFVSRLKLGVSRCGLDATTISCHSLRRGGATMSFACGMSSDQVKARGDWASDCYRQYLVIDSEDNLVVARALSSFAASKSLR
jgi:hypothetical protein